MDIEGSEPAALRGMHKFLERVNYPPIYTEVNAINLCMMGETKKSLLSITQEMGYRAYLLQNGRLIESSPDDLPEVVCEDYLLIKEMPEAWLAMVDSYTPETQEATVKRLATRLKTHRTWVPHDVYLVYAIKDYPDLYNHPEINALLYEIEKEQRENPLYEIALGWMAAMPGKE